MSLEVISLNIEGDNHFDTIFPFFQKEQADVLCLQEFFAADLPLLEERTGMRGVVVPVQQVLRPNNYRQTLKGAQGIAIFSKEVILDGGFAFYVSEPVTDTLDSEPNAGRRAVLWVDLKKGDVTYRVATTHFTWSVHGEPSGLQRADLRNLFEKLDSIHPDLVCGDFNAPRGRATFDALASRFTDNIPPTITTSIDPHLHRVPGLSLMVDGFFTPEHVKASNVRVVDGVSDHCAIVGEIYKK